jgi:hypothetical protein
METATFLLFFLVLVFLFFFLRKNKKLVKIIIIEKLAIKRFDSVVAFIILQSNIIANELFLASHVFNNLQMK